MRRADCPDCGAAIDVYNRAVACGDVHTARVALAVYDEHRDALHPAEVAE